MIFPRISAALLFTTFFWNAEACSGSYTLKKGETPFAVAARNFISLNVLKMCNQDVDIFNLKAGQVIKYPECKVSRPYVVGEGETLETVAKMFDANVGDILDCNYRLPRPDSLVPGQEIQVPADPNTLSSEPLSRQYSHMA
ncbi:hypothetical protein MP638_001043 [Amoeboaphelidium occidentale]|nr:hypothetical protein MP638_001043 [Amoeboaphelidium occidentale]